MNTKMWYNKNKRSIKGGDKMSINELKRQLNEGIKKNGHLNQEELIEKIKEQLNAAPSISSTCIHS